MNAEIIEFEALQEILSAMRERESKVYRLTFQPNELEGLWRKILFDWMTFVVDHCKLQRQAVAAASYYLDFAMSRGLLETREDHQLCAASALQLALKLFDSTVIRKEKLVNLGRGLFTEDDLVAMEFKMVKAMNFCCHPPSSYCFLRQYDLLLPSTLPEATRNMVDEVTKVVAYLAILDPEYNAYSTSVIAYGAILMAMEMISCEDFPIHQRQCFILRMSTISKLDSSSPLIVSVCEKLKETLEASSKLEDLLKSLNEKQLQACKCSDDREHKSTTTFSAKIIQSPRDVMGRLGSFSKSGSFSSLREALPQ